MKKKLRRLFRQFSYFGGIRFGCSFRLLPMNYWIWIVTAHNTSCSLFYYYLDSSSAKRFVKVSKIFCCLFLISYRYMASISMENLLLAWVKFTFLNISKPFYSFFSSSKIWWHYITIIGNYWKCNNFLDKYCTVFI